MKHVTRFHLPNNYSISSEQLESFHSCGVECGHCRRRVRLLLQKEYRQETHTRVIISDSIIYNQAIWAVCRQQIARLCWLMESELTISLASG
jgi:bacterioferritin-associated ferredoxin